MEIVLFVLIAGGFSFFKARSQQRRIALLGGYLGRFEIEKLMQTLMDGYLRALGEEHPERQAQVWSYLADQEEKLFEQFRQFSEAFSAVQEADARVSKFPIALPGADQWAPWATFDMRLALQIHAQGLAQAMASSPSAHPKDRAFTITAELMLMQHTCHWFCRSRTVASARLLARHKTRYEQVLAAVLPQTRQAYLRLLKPTP
ncbi:MAG: hypothetical protein K9K38_19490 [Rhodoferax sp.]|nr:hypothetical protein [Rhodoferax sp.]